MRCLLTLLLITSAMLTRAQQISGLVKDDSGKPLQGATVSLVKVSDTATVKLALTRADGAFTISGIKSPRSTHNFVK